MPRESDEALRPQADRLGAGQPASWALPGNPKSVLDGGTPHG